MKPIALLVFVLAISSCLFSQKKFNVVLSFPNSLDLSNLNIKIDNGFGRMSVQFKRPENNEIVLSDFYYSKYAAVIVDYPKGENSQYRNFFFLDEQAATIKFLVSAKDSSPFDHYILTNAYDFKTERNKMGAFSSAEVGEVEKYLEKYGSQIFDGNHAEQAKHFGEIENNIYKKDIEYIKRTGNSYYSFWYFRSNAHYSGLPVDSILSIFDRAFPEKLKTSIEGNAYRQLLLGKLNTKKGSAAAQFTSKDLNGNVIALSSFKDKKYVLLDFWATWCVPCIKEMPLLKSLHEKFAQDLEIISIAYPTSLSEVKDVIAKQKMSWINIYNDTKLINSFGGMGAIPRLFLIDRSGKIIYDNKEDNDVNSTVLTRLLEKNVGIK